MPDPKLKLAMTEVQEVLTKHDLAAVVFLASPTHTEYMLKFDPSWSCAYMTAPDATGGRFLRFRSKKEDYPNLEAQKRHVTYTTGMMLGFLDAMRANIGHLEGVTKLLGQHFDITHWSRRDD